MSWEILAKCYTSQGSRHRTLKWPEFSQSKGNWGQETIALVASNNFGGLFLKEQGYKKEDWWNAYVRKKSIQRTIGTANIAVFSVRHLGQELFMYLPALPYLQIINKHNRKSTGLFGGGKVFARNST